MQQTFIIRLRGPVDIRALFKGAWILKNISSSETNTRERWSFARVARGRLVVFRHVADSWVEVGEYSNLEDLRRANETNEIAVPGDVLRRLYRKLGVAMPARPRPRWLDDYIAFVLRITQREANMRTAAYYRSSRQPWNFDDLYLGAGAALTKSA